MRNISAASLAALEQKTGIEPVLIARIWWGGNLSTNYCDRKFEGEGLIGKLLEISGIEDVVDINAAASSVALSLTLDDSDGAIKNIYDHKDIHKVRVQILQWFSLLPLSEAFPIFEGQISSPIIWSEGARTLKFDVITQLEDREVGFSAEEGKFQFIPVSIIGQAWPLVFGRVAGVKALPLTEAPTAIFASGFSIVDQAVWAAEIADLDAAILDDFKKAQEAYRLGVNNAFIAGAYKQFGSLPDDPDQALQFDNAAQQYFAQANQYSNTYLQLINERQAKLDEKELQESYEFRVIPITQTNMPSGVSLSVEFGNYTATGLIIGPQMILTNLVEKPDINQKAGTNTYDFGTTTNSYTKDSAKGQKFVWIDGGTEVKIHNFPRYYIASIGHITVINVWAKNDNGRAVVPANWYTISYETYNTLQATRIIFPTPLTSYPGGWQDGDIEIDCENSVGPNVVDIMRWVIDRFCTLEVDVASFNHVRNRVNNYPANFVLTERKEVINFLQEVAFQSRCAIWINDNKFYIRYLPERLTAVDTLTDSDIEVNTLTLTTTDTEKLVTKFTALWKASANQSEPNKIVYRNNIKKYGVHEEEYNFYIYNNHDLVAKSAEFWMIRKSNLFKIVSFNVLLHKLRLETFDPVAIDLNEGIVASTVVTGIIQKATFNPDDDAISMEVWLPVRLGEMSVYDFAQPMNVQNFYPVVGDPNVKTGSPFDGATGELAPQSTFAPYQQLTFSRYDPFTHGRGQSIGDAQDTAPGTLVTALTPNSLNQSRPAGIEKFNTETKRTINEIVSPTIKQVLPGTWFGFVVEKIDDSNYSVRVYFNGFDQDYQLKQVRIGLIRPEAVLPADYPLTVHRAVWFDSTTGLSKFEYWAQPPIWVAPNED